MPRDHFAHNIPRWESIIKPYLKSAKSIRVLDIVPNAARSSVWILENLPESTLVAVDVANRPSRKYQENLRKFTQNQRASIITGKTIHECLHNLTPDSFDLVNIDLGPDSRFTLEAAVLAFPLLKAKGIMVFDDYTTDHHHGYRCPKPAIDRFTDIYARYIKVIHASWEFILVKRSKPLGSKMCKSEYYHERLQNV
jgi:predicted O-methyltransferase YrrM